MYSVLRETIRPKVYNIMFEIAAIDDINFTKE
jgi:hypothetical protein